MRQAAPSTSTPFCDDPCRGEPEFAQRCVWAYPAGSEREGREPPRRPGMGHACRAGEIDSPGCRQERPHRAGAGAAPLAVRLQANRAGLAHSRSYSSVVMQYRSLGRVAAQVLLWNLDGDEESGVITLPCSLVGPLRAQPGGSGVDVPSGHTSG